jgi:Integrase core domain
MGFRRLMVADLVRISTRISRGPRRGRVGQFINVVFDRCSWLGFRSGRCKSAGTSFDHCGQQAWSVAENRYRVTFSPPTATNYIQPGKSMQNGHIESFNRRLRDECLNANWFRNLFDARGRIANWRHDYNSTRPHSGLAYRTPNAYAAQWQRASSSLISIPQPEPAVHVSLKARSRAALMGEPGYEIPPETRTKGSHNGALTC